MYKIIVNKPPGSNQNASLHLLTQGVSIKFEFVVKVWLVWSCRDRTTCDVGFGGEWWYALVTLFRFLILFTCINFFCFVVSCECLRGRCACVQPVGVRVYV